MNVSLRNLRRGGKANLVTIEIMLTRNLTSLGPLLRRQTRSTNLTLHILRMSNYSSN
jgi:hypothetical protein